MSEKISKPLSIIIISILGILVYSNTFFCSFHFDDEPSITINYAIRNIHDLQSIWDVLPRRFILYLSIALNYHFNGLHVFGYHLFNLGVHLISAILVWWLALLTLSTPALKGNKITQHADLIALFAGLVFVAHPVQTQAVTYIVQRAASMSALFYVASLCLYVKSRLLHNDKSRVVPRRFYYTCSLMTAVVGMFTKETAVTLPLMILLYEFSFLRTKKDFNWRYSVPFLLTLLIIPLTMLMTETGAARLQQLRSEPGISSLHYLLTQFRVMVTYIRLVFFPFNQNLDYDYPIFKSIFELPVLMSVVFLMTILFWAVRLFSKYKIVSFSIFWFFLTLLPESSFLPIKDVIFEHRLYLPLVGGSIFLVSGMYYLLVFISDTLRYSGKNIISMMVMVLTLVVACYAILAYQRNKVWKDDFTLWEDTLKKSPHKARPHNNLGNAYLDQGKYSQAMSEYNEALKIDPVFKKSYYNRGLIYGKQGNLTQAMINFNKTIELDPRYAQAYNNRGCIYADRGSPTKAISDYDKTIELDPYNAEAYFNRGITYAKQENYTQAISDLNKAIEINPDYTQAYKNRDMAYAKQKNLSDSGNSISSNPPFAETYYNRGIAYVNQGDFSQAISNFDKAIEINPHYAEAYNNRGSSYYNQGNLTKAMSDYDMAIRIDPKHAQAYNNRGNIYDKQGNFTQAVANFNKAIELNPDYSEAFYNRGNAYYHQKDFTQAIADYNKAIEINPAYAGAYYDRALSYYQLTEYDKAWADTQKLEKLGVAVNPDFIRALKLASGRD